MRALLVLLLATVLASAEPPRLLVLVSIDQLRPDTLTRFAAEYRGGLKRLLAEGRRYHGVHDHAATETGPGHATLATGCHPSHNGIVANQWLDPASLEPMYCVAGGTPANMLRPALGDWLKARDARARVVSVAGKDRSAILMGGLHPDAALWFDRETCGFTSSDYYFAAGKPDWLTAFPGDGWLDTLPETWSYEPAPAEHGLRPDDDPQESPRFSRTSPHPLRADDRKAMAARVYVSPYVDELTLRLAADVAVRYDLGGDEVPDLLCVGLSATDTIGHSYGPFSQEIRDSMLRLDRELGAFFDLLDRRRAPYVLALSADHGVLPLTEIKRVPFQAAAQQLQIAITKRLGDGDWCRLAGGDLYVNRAYCAAHDADPAAVARALAEAAATLDSVQAAYGPDDLKGSGGDELLGLVRRSWRADRSGEVCLVQKERIVFDAYGTGTTHGSPYRYDREVPIVFFGAGFAAGVQDGEVRTVDIAPTLAAAAGVAPPADADGHPLPRE